MITTTIRRGLSALTLSALLAACGGSESPETPDGASSGERLRALAIRPAAGNLSAAGSFAAPFEMGLIAVHMALQPDGRLMYYGTRPSGEQTGLFEYGVWDPADGTGADSVTLLPNGGGTDLFCSAQTLLPQDGRTFIAGGDQAGVSNAANNNANVFDYRNNSLTRGTNMHRARWYASLTTLMNGEIYIQGGSGGGDRPEVRQTDGSFRLLSGVNTSDFDTYYPKNWVAPDGRVFGFESNGSMYYVDPAGSGAISAQGVLPVANGGIRSPAAMFRPGHILKLATTSTAATVIDISRGGAPVLRATEAGAAVRVHGTAVTLPDGQVLVLGGSSRDNDLASAHYTADTWNPVTGQWTIGAVATKARLYHGSSLLLPDGRVLMAGGGAPGPLINTTGEIYTPPYLYTTGNQLAARPAITAAPTVVQPGQAFIVDMAQTGASRVSFVRFGSVTHSWNADQRYLALPFGADATGKRLTVRLPSRATDTPPGFYMLFVLDANGVPSVARTVRVGLPGQREAARPPVMADIADQTWQSGPVTLRPVASSPRGATLRYSASGLPPGLVVNPATGVVTGTPAAAGTYYVTLAADDGAWTGTRSFRWTIAPDTFVLSPVTTSGPILAGGTVNVTTSAGGAGATYSWNFGDGTAATAWSADPRASHRFTRPGFFAVTVTARDASGRLAQTQTVMQRVGLAPTARAAVNSSQFAWQQPAGGTPRLWVVNPDSDTVSALSASTGLRLAEIGVGAHPTSIALARDGRLWVANHRSASLTVIDTANQVVERTIALPFASAPFGVVADPSGNGIYVTLEASGRLLRFDATSFAQTASVAVGANPRHLGITGDGSAVYVSRFITPPLPNESRASVTTTGVGGELVKVLASTMSVERTLLLAHSDKPDAENQGRGIPNYLGAPAISPDGTQAFVPSKQDNIRRGTLRDGLNLNFQNTVRAVTSRIVLGTQQEDLAGRIDHDNASLASAATFDPSGVLMFVALETSREVAVVNAHTRQELMRVVTGLAPQGLQVSPDGSTLYVHNFMDRTVGIYDLRPLLLNGQLAMPLRSTAGTINVDKLSPQELRGKQLFYDARDIRLSRDRYMSCATCHADGGHDGRVWDLSGFGEGLRNTASLRGRGGLGHGALHWSGNFDEVQDFEGQIRTLAGGTGLMANADFNAGTRSQPLGDRKAGRSADLDALAAYVGSLASTEPSPQRGAGGVMTADAVAGQALFAASCVQCHGGDRFTDSRLDGRHDIGTIGATSGKRLGGALGGLDTPTLRDAWATAPYLHDGSARTIAEAIARHTAVPAVAALSAGQRTQLAAYVGQLGGQAAAPAWAGTADTTAPAFAATRQADGSVLLTPAQPGQFGMLWARDAWSTTQAFSTRIEVSLKGTAPQADGMALVLTAATGQTPALGGPGGCLGLCTGTPHVAAVIRSYTTSTLGLESKGTSIGTVAAKPAGVSFLGAASITGQVTLSYNPAARQLRADYALLVDGMPRNFSDVLNVDLRAVFGERMAAAVTAGSGAKFSAQSVSGWSTRFGATSVARNADLSLVSGAALPAEGELRLTDAARGGVGAAWLRTPWNTAEAFSTSFDFSLQGTGTTTTQADGFGFVLQAVGPTTIGTPGGCIGACGIRNYLGATVKTHVRNSAGLFSSEAEAPGLPVDLGTARSITGHATVTWDPVAKRLSMHGTAVADGRSIAFSDQQDIDLRARFGPAVYAGFTAATGGARSTQTVTRWTTEAGAVAP